jgi:DNA repair ATPase RecN
MGSASPNECVRAPASCAVVEGMYALDARASETTRALLSACGLPAKALPPIGARASDLVVRREIVQAVGAGSGSGTTRSRCFVNGAATSLRVLRDLGQLLVDSNGQHSAQSLR